MEFQTDVLAQDTSRSRKCTSPREAAGSPPGRGADAAAAPGADNSRLLANVAAPARKPRHFVFFSTFTDSSYAEKLFPLPPALTPTRIQPEPGRASGGRKRRGGEGETFEKVALC